MSTARAKPLINKRRAARLAAVQALYQLEVTQGRVELVVAEFGRHRLADLLEPMELEGAPPEVDRKWFDLLVTGAWNARERLDVAIEQNLASDWTLARLGYLLRACLRAGSFELADRTDVPVKVVINEYIEVAHVFFDEAECGFVNAVLDRLAPHLRDPQAAT